MQEDKDARGHGEGGFRLTAGAVLFPSRWALLDKIGKDMHAIHRSVNAGAFCEAPGF